MMKNIIKLIILLILSNGLNGQSNNQLKVTSTNISVLFVGLDNHISIETNDGKAHNFMVELYKCQGFCYEQEIKTLSKYEDASIVKEGNNTYNIRINKNFGNLLLVVKENVNGNSIDYGSKWFKVRQVPRPILDLGDAHKSGGSCDLAELKKLKQLNVKLENFTRTDLNFKVISYKFLALGRKTGGPKFANSMSSSLEPIKSLLDQLTIGDIIQFSDIRVVGPSQQILLLDNFSSTIGVKTESIEQLFDRQLKLDSIDNIQNKLSLDLDLVYGRGVKLTKGSLLKNLVEYYQNGNFNDESPFFKKNLIKYEIVNGKFEQFVFNELQELKKSNGLVKDNMRTVSILNANIASEDWDAMSDPSNYHDTSIIERNNSKLNKIYFDKVSNTLTKNTEWYLFAEYNQRTIAIPVSEFSKERIIFPQIVANYLDYLNKNDFKRFEKYRVFTNQSHGKDSISNGRLDFFEKAAEYQLQKMYFKLITGSLEGFNNVFMGYHRDEIYLQSWNKLLSKSRSNYSPDWYSSDSILNFNSSSIPHDTFVKRNQNIMVYGNKITNEDIIYPYISLQNILGFDVLSKINQDGTASSYLMVKINREIMNLNIDINYYLHIPKVYGIFDDTEKIIISDIYKFGYSNLEILRK